MLFGFILAGFALLFGAGAAETRHLEQLAATDIKSKLEGPRAKVDVRTRAVGLKALSGHLKRVMISASDFTAPGLPLFTEPELSQSGRIDDLRIELRNFALGALGIAELSSSIPDCRYDLGLAINHGKIRLSKSGLGTGSVTVTAGALEPFILHKYREIKSVHVEIGNGHVRVSGYGEFLIIHTQFEVEATISPVEGTKLYLTDAQITFDGKPADPLSKKALLDTLNPVVDLNKDLRLYGAIEVEKVSLDKGVLRADGTTSIPNRPTITSDSSL